MATTTANYGLTKPERSDNYSVDVMSGNMDKIDSAIKTETDAVAQRVGTLEGKVSAIENEVNGDLVCNSVTAGTIAPTKIIVPFNSSGIMLLYDINQRLTVDNSTSTSNTFCFNNSGIFECTGTYKVTFTANAKYDTNNTPQLTIYVNNTVVYDKTISLGTSSKSITSVDLHAGDSMYAVWRQPKAGYCYLTIAGQAKI